MKKYLLLSLIFLAILNLFPLHAFSETFEVIMYDNSFKPSSLAIKVGDTVLWVDKGEISHTSVSGTRCIPDRKWHSGYLLPERMAPHKSTYNRVFNEPPGTYPYFCEQHCPEMEGTIVVIP